MRLTTYEQEMLDGQHGDAKRISMEKLVDFGVAVDAEEMVQLSNVHHGTCVLMPRSTPEYSKYELGQSPLFEQFIEMGATVTDNPNCICSTDPLFLQHDKYEEEGYPWNHRWYKMPKVIYDAVVKGYEECKRMGWVLPMSCTPHFNTVIPKMGEFVVTVESSYAAYINSILGARANRENTVTLIYAAITGVHPKYGTMLDENRSARVIFEIDDEVKENMVYSADWAAMGAAIAIKSDNRIPAILNLPKPISNEAAKLLTACTSPGMNDPMLHLVGISPESPTLEAAFGGTIPKDVEKFTITLADMKETYEKLYSAKSDKVDIVHVGCPHLTYNEIRQIAGLIEGKKVNDNVYFWAQTDTPTYYMAHHHGEAQVIEKAGGKIYHSTCFGLLPLRDWGNDLNIATNSFKGIKLFGGQGQGWIFGAIPDLINAAVTGKFVSTRW
ncbi:MAG: aconitase X catalytic domain-containing protein [Desulfobacteraceae bacterium]|uniref:Aconitase X catalytic domain-containing protein n=1 Tax=Candidatus Desulfacyla euxinica TaxID=2841693 RepID=A0A8J6N0W0_9DELT|nr:aconitase X catalytic domain-containing protein [Candidatus Desulfacyla euxinica]MBL6977648.1 aconitase X catalytic domain-containing protein [Desulfobacteraceae bacterium]